MSACAGRPVRHAPGDEDKRAAAADLWPERGGEGGLAEAVLHVDLLRLVARKRRREDEHALRGGGGFNALYVIGGFALCAQ